MAEKNSSMMRTNNGDATANLVNLAATLGGELTQ